jgi:hypothetical protein
MREDPRQNEVGEYRSGENGFYQYKDNGFCYDDDGFSYRFGEDGFDCDTEEGRRYDSGGFCCDKNGVRVEYVEWPQTSDSFSLGVHPLEPGSPRGVRTRTPLSRKRVNIVDLVDAEPETIRRPWRPRPSVS